MLSQSNAEGGVRKISRGLAELMEHYIAVGSLIFSQSFGCEK
jgi:hypothetical protein